MILIDKPKTYSRTHYIPFEKEDEGVTNSDSDFEDNFVLKQYPAVKKKYKGKSKYGARQDPAFKANGINYQGKSKQKARQIFFITNECAVDMVKEKIQLFKQMRLNTRVNQNKQQDKVFHFKQMNVQLKIMKDKIQLFKQTGLTTKENQNKQQYKIRHSEPMKYNEAKGKTRSWTIVSIKKAICQRLSKQNARKRPLMLELKNKAAAQKAAKNIHRFARSGGSLSPPIAC